MLLLPLGPCPAQQPPAPTDPQDQTRDAVLDEATNLIGKPLFLRCFCADNNLSFDAAGKLESGSKATDWTVAAVNATKVERKGRGVVELDGVRVAVAYNAGAHEFQRHPQTDEKMRILLADTGDAKAFRRMLAAVFAIGIDRPLQQAMPDEWRHYFDPKLAWPADGLTDVTVYQPGPAGLAVGTASTPAASVPVAGSMPVTAPEVAHGARAAYTGFALHDHVKGTTQVRFVVDATGVARHVSIALPQGYGLDEKAAETVRRMRFAPAMRDGKPVAATVLLNQEFELVASPQ